MSNTKNYTQTNIGTFKDFSKIGRLELGKSLQLTGSEISFNHLEKGQFTPFVHAHKQNEELYIIISGKGQFMLDNEVIELKEGSIVKVSPKCERAIKADDLQSITFACLQTQENSLKQATNDDGIICKTKASWMK